MQKRLAAIAGAAFLLALTCGSDRASAADLGGTFSGGCDCASDMIVIYDSEPGVVVRNWKGDCDCRYAADPRRRYRMAVRSGPRYESLRDPWRR